MLSYNSDKFNSNLAAIAVIYSLNALLLDLILLILGCIMDMSPFLMAVLGVVLLTGVVKQKKGTRIRVQQADMMVDIVERIIEMGEEGEKE